MHEIVAKSSPFSNRFWSHKITGTSHDEAHVSWFTTSGNVARLLLVYCYVSVVRRNLFTPGFSRSDEHR